jgi:hypothetical protein
MRTDDLIAVLSQDARPVLPTPERALAAPLLLAAAVAVGASLSILGLRDDVWEALAGGWFGAKLALAAALGAVGVALTLRSAAPGRLLSLWPAVMVAGALALLVGADIVLLGPEDAAERALGDNALKCLFFVPTLSIAPLVALLWALREGAATRPALTGALAGLTAGGIGAFAYGVHCTDDSPLFLAVWYAAAIALVMAAGALAGSRALRW